MPSEKGVWHAPTTSQPRPQSRVLTFVTPRMRFVASLRCSACAGSQQGFVAGCACVGCFSSVQSASFVTSALAPIARISQRSAVSSARLAWLLAAWHEPHENQIPTCLAIRNSGNKVGSLRSIEKSVRAALRSRAQFNTKRATIHGFHLRESWPHARMPDAHLRRFAPRSRRLPWFTNVIPGGAWATIARAEDVTGNRTVCVQSTVAGWRMSGARDGQA